jgi:hypothetical protein
MKSHIAHGGKGLDLAIENVRTAYREYMQDTVATAKACVDEGGGTWVGTMDCNAYVLVLFNSRKTGSTLALKATEITPEKVREQIAASDKKFTTQRSTILSVQEKI